MTTVADVLQTLALPDDLPGIKPFGATPATGSYSWVVAEKGHAGWVLCGGTAILSIETATVSRRPCYVVLDDFAGEQWAAQIRNGKTVGAIGPRPGLVMRLVQSA